MAEQIIGLGQFRSRLQAIEQVGRTGKMVTKAGDLTIGRMRINMPRATSNTSRTLHVEDSGASAGIWGSVVARWLDEGTGLYGPRHHKIVPTSRRALALHSSGKGAGLGASYRLTGRMTVGSVRRLGANADLVVVRSVKGMKARPYIDRSIAEAAQKLGPELFGLIVKAWDAA